MLPTMTASCACCPHSWKVPAGVFQAYASYWPEGYIAHLAWAAAWMCRYDVAFCRTADRWLNTALGVNNLRYGLGYDVRCSHACGLN
jgi:hypothetical protein